MRFEMFPFDGIELEKKNYLLILEKADIYLFQLKSNYLMTVYTYILLFMFVH